MSNTNKRGLITGVLMAIILMLLSVTGEYGGEPIKYIKYVILIISLGFYLKTSSSNQKDFYLHALPDGVQISAIAGLVVAIANIIGYSVKPEFAVAKYSLVPETMAGALAVSGALLFEITVIGMIVSFIFFQYFKNQPTKETEMLDVYDN